MQIRRNTLGWERIMRLVLGIAAAAAPLLWEVAVPWLWGLTGASLGLTALFGFCPVCAVAGRSPVDDA